MKKRRKDKDREKQERETNEDTEELIWHDMT